MSASDNPEDDEGIGGKCICVQLIAISKELLNRIYIYLLIYSIHGTETTIIISLLTVVGGRVGYQAWQELCCVWLELVCHKCLGQSGIWTGFDGELWGALLYKWPKSYGLHRNSI